MSRCLGRLLRGVHAGDRKLLWNQPLLIPEAPVLQLGSDALEDGGSVPPRFAGAGVGSNVSPPLYWGGAPARTLEFALVLEDPDAPLPQPFVHLLLLGIPSTCRAMSEGHLPGTLGLNSFRRRAYAGPRALPGHGPHRYVFQLFALSCRMDTVRIRTRSDFLRAAAGHVLARGRFDVFFERP